MKNYYSIGETAKLLGVNIMTLRRWEKKGKLVPVRSKGKHRYYHQEDVNEYIKNTDVFKQAVDWIEQKEDKKPLIDAYYCQDIYIFQARLTRLESELIKKPELKEVYSLIVSLIGEIGNNSFDHNIGNWPGVPGIFFAYNLNTNHIALADRGQGILKTLSRVKPGLNNDKDAVYTGFTEIISGRAPEARGNGLKYVKNIIVNNNINLDYQSGNARLRLKSGDEKLNIRELKNSRRGCIALIEYNY